MSDLVETISNVVVAGAAVWAGWVAYRGLRTWKAQLNHEYARRILEACIRQRSCSPTLREILFELDCELTHRWCPRITRGIARPSQASDPVLYIDAMSQLKGATNFNKCSTM